MVSVSIHYEINFVPLAGLISLILGLLHSVCYDLSGKFLGHREKTVVGGSQVFIYLCMYQCSSMRHLVLLCVHTRCHQFKLMMEILSKAQRHLACVVF